MYLYQKIKFKTIHIGCFEGTEEEAIEAVSKNIRIQRKLMIILAK